MGILDGMMGNASEADVQQTQQEMARMLAPGETVEKSYVLVRDMLVFTNRRLILVDKQGMTGKKTQYVSIPYGKITRFSVETAGTLDMDSELRIWTAGEAQPIQKQFGKKIDIHEVQALLASRV